ncbi:ferritin [Petroclostridium sp. X23]|uniref:ferritin n=1 Tax=Petroclostridium sp. X23 TaxID=3045146 RepID=UPI0024ACB5A1|nr:ferritin [Petroclostridium sp. X23]WHH57005.1 ferritin [Petroclostridium sp. X23]
MLSEKLVQEINTQIKYELESAHLYMAMAAYCDAEDLPGFSNFFKVQVEEERFHAMKFYNYLNDMGERIILHGLEEPNNNYSSVLDAFQKSLKHEEFVTKRIYMLMDIANEEKEHATISFLKWFIDEQVEEISTFTAVVKKLQRVSDNPAGLYMLDDELAQRVFTPPAADTGN